MMNNSDDESIAGEEERRRDEERRREAGIGVPGATGAEAGDQSAARKEERRREAGVGVAGATGPGSNGKHPDERRRETWLGLLGAAFLGAFLLIFFQGSLVQGFQSLTGPTSPVIRSSSGTSSQGVVPNAGSLTQTAQTAAGNSQVTPTVAASILTPTVLAVEGPLTAPFTGGATAVRTSQSYTGPMTITVSGTGQAQGTMHSDAFYIYTDAHGNPVAPSHHTYATLCINGHPVDQFVQPIPPYSSDHTYKLTINAPGGPLTFGVCDSILTDNSGSFTITFS